MVDPVDLVVTSRVRFPPFESSLKIAAAMPIAEQERLIRSDRGIDLSRIKMGDSDGWLVERQVQTIAADGSREDWQDDSAQSIDSPFPPLVEQQRTGWYLTPHPIHLIARKSITISVTILLIALTYQAALEPLLIFLDIMSGPLAGSIRLGMLDYPFLMVFVIPLMVFPLLLRLAANVRDLLRQREFLESPPESPVVSFEGDASSDCSLNGTLRIPESRKDWTSIRVWWQVGLLPPAREDLLAAHGRDEGSQPPPGLSTRLPQYWEGGLSDGTGFGEDSPIEHRDVPGGMFLRPMRILSMAGRAPLPVSGGSFKLTPPASPWPGTQYDGLIRVHWEFVVRINRQNKGPLFWVMPMRVRNGSGPFIVESLEVNDGRTENLVI